jgi:hypothetical protein
MCHGATDRLDIFNADNRLTFARGRPGRYNRVTEFGVGPTPAMLRRYPGLDLIDAGISAIYGTLAVNGGPR